MSAWVEGARDEDIKEGEKVFEDNFVSEDQANFKKLDDSEQYLRILGEIC